MLSHNNFSGALYNFFDDMVLARDGLRLHMSKFYNDAPLCVTWYSNSITEYEKWRKMIFYTYRPLVNSNEAQILFIDDFSLLIKHVCSRL